MISKTVIYRSKGHSKYFLTSLPAHGLSFKFWPFSWYGFRIQTDDFSCRYSSKIRYYPLSNVLRIQLFCLHIAMNTIFLVHS